MAEKINFELVSPQKLVSSADVDMVIVPGVEGDFGALPHHSPMISVIRPGVIDVYNNDQVTDRIFVAGGFAEVTEERCTILAEEAYPLSDITADLIDHRLQKAEQALKNAENDVEKANAHRHKAIAESMRASL